VAKFVSQGTPAGERAFIEFEETAARFKTFDDLGMRVKMQGQLRELLEARQGMFLFSSLPSLGLRSTMDVVLHSCDRFVRDFVALEEKNDRYRSVENIPLTTYNAAEGENPVAVLQRLLRTQPNVVVVRDIANLEIVNLLTEAAADKLVIASLRAKDCADVLMRILAMGVPPAMLAKAVTAVHSQRLVRKLCGACMEAYTPTTQILQQLGVPEGRVDVFYRPRQTKPDDGGERCSKCGGTGFVGRTAIFELLVVGDAVRKTLNAKPNLELLKVAARKDGMKSLQEEGILLVAKGVTSLPELMRVLK
jgi:type II secretory ATPase GspE/PulE/Tfp pilus assembly ATPase PilB-like protein